MSPVTPMTSASAPLPELCGVGEQSATEPESRTFRAISCLLGGRGYPDGGVVDVAVDVVVSGAVVVDAGGLGTVVVGTGRCGTVVEGMVFGTVAVVPIVNEATVVDGCCKDV